MKVTPILCLNDNYAYLAVCEQTNQAAVVDPSEALPVLAEVERQGVELVSVLATHHHWDHVGGVLDLARNFEKLKVYGHRLDEKRIEGITNLVDQGDRVHFGEVELKVLHNPGHTSGAISYQGEGVVFTGDTMFSGGCGRVFEGTPEMMYHSLVDVLGVLDDDTLIYFGHEYTANNLRFALTVDPENKDVQSRLEEVAGDLKAGRITTPSTMGLERKINPFLRVNEPAIRAAVLKDRPADGETPEFVFAALREMKNLF
ncbi:MAG: hydroxyacylglutathione hydrolase [Deltaproteobacteria bacterium]|nr:hydroxyacylglutathione hydrolase [Deltaproteobacteria bacterium]